VHQAEVVFLTQYNIDASMDVRMFYYLVYIDAGARHETTQKEEKIKEGELYQHTGVT
jgi:hypothetical protein